MVALAGNGLIDEKSCIIGRYVLDGSPILALAYDVEGDLYFGFAALDHIEDARHLIALKHNAIVGYDLDRSFVIRLGREAIRVDVGGT